MFQPAIFREDRIEILHDLIRTHPFATLVTCPAGLPVADHIPIVLHSEASGKSVLQGHLATGNPLARAGHSELDALVVFQGPQSYITPSWYASKMQHGKVVPTWNYVVVHARGTLRLIRNSDWLLHHLRDLTEQQENGREDPWAVDDAPSDFLQRQLRGLVGIEVDVTELEGTWKVSQNKTGEDAAGVAKGLLDANDPEGGAIAELVEGRRRQ